MVAATITHSSASARERYEPLLASRGLPDAAPARHRSGRDFARPLFLRLDSRIAHGVLSRPIHTIPRIPLCRGALRASGTHMPRSQHHAQHEKHAPEHAIFSPASIQHARTGVSDLSAPREPSEPRRRRWRPPHVPQWQPPHCCTGAAACAAASQLHAASQRRAVTDTWCGDEGSKVR